MKANSDKQIGQGPEFKLYDMSSELAKLVSLAWHKAFSQPLPCSACNTTDLTEVDGLLSKNTVESKVHFDKPQRSELQLVSPEIEIRNLTFVQIRIIFPVSKHKQPL